MAEALKNNQIPHALASWSLNLSLIPSASERAGRYHLLQQRGVSTFRSRLLAVQWFDALARNWNSTLLKQVVSSRSFGSRGY